MPFQIFMPSLLSAERRQDQGCVHEHGNRWQHALDMVTVTAGVEEAVEGLSRKDGNCQQHE